MIEYELMILSKKAINSAIKQDKLRIQPFDPEQISAAHIDLHIKSSVIIPPKGFIISRTLEKITLSDDLCGFIEGRAGLAKQGVSIEQSSTFIEPGTNSDMTLEIFNANDKQITLAAGQPIAKMFITKIVDDL